MDIYFALTPAACISYNIVDTWSRGSGFSSRFFSTGELFHDIRIFARCFYRSGHPIVFVIFYVGHWKIALDFTFLVTAWVNWKNNSCI